MSDDTNEQFCRNERCPIIRRHLVADCPLARRGTIVVHHRPKRDAPFSQREAPAVLTESVERAIGEWPTMMQWIQRDVRDDYGNVADRTIYRHVRRLVKSKRVVKLNLGLAFAAYIKPGARMLRDREALREFMEQNADCIPNSTKTGARQAAV